MKNYEVVGKGFPEHGHAAQKNRNKLNVKPCRTPLGPKYRRLFDATATLRLRMLRLREGEDCQSVGTLQKQLTVPEDIFDKIQNCKLCNAPLTQSDGICARKLSVEAAERSHKVI